MRDEGPHGSKTPRGKRSSLVRPFPPDTDECLGSPCQQRCRNSIGSYTCSCRPGFHLHGNRHACVGEAGDPGCQSRGGTEQGQGRTGRGRQAGSRHLLVPEPVSATLRSGRPSGRAGSSWKTPPWAFPGRVPVRPVVALPPLLPGTPQDSSLPPFSWPPVLRLVNVARSASGLGGDPAFSALSRSFQSLWLERGSRAELGSPGGNRTAFQPRPGQDSSRKGPPKPTPPGGMVRGVDCGSQRAPPLRPALHHCCPLLGMRPWRTH